MWNKPLRWSMFRLSSATLISCKPRLSPFVSCLFSISPLLCGEEWEEGEINAPQAGNAFRRKGGPGSGKTEHFLSLQHIPPFFSVCFSLRAATALRILFLLLNVFILYWNQATVSSHLTDHPESESCCLAFHFHLFIWQASPSPFIEFRLLRSGSGGGSSSKSMRVSRNLFEMNLLNRVGCRYFKFNFFLRGCRWSMRWNLATRVM